MPNSLRCKIKTQMHKGLLTEKDGQRLIDALDKADKYTKMFPCEIGETVYTLKIYRRYKATKVSKMLYYTIPNTTLEREIERNEIIRVETVQVEMKKAMYSFWNKKVFKTRDRANWERIILERQIREAQRGESND